MLTWEDFSVSDSTKKTKSNPIRPCNKSNNNPSWRCQIQPFSRISMLIQSMTLDHMSYLATMTTIEFLSMDVSEITLKTSTKKLKSSVFKSGKMDSESLRLWNWSSKMLVKTWRKNGAKLLTCPHNKKYSISTMKLSILYCSTT